MAWLTTTPWISTARRAAAVLALSSCALDSAGVVPEEGTTSAGGSTSATTASGPGSTGPTTTTASGDGGSSVATGGAGPSSGGGGAGDGGSAGAGGAGGDPGPEEWIKLLAGADHQTIQDIALSTDGVSAYVVGIARQDLPTFDGWEPPLTDPEGDDIFVAKVPLDGGAVLWAAVFGGGGDDQGRSVAVGLDALGEERLYLGGIAKGRNAGEGDFFAPGLETATGDDFGWVIELDAGSGVAKNGVPWSPVTLEDTVDLAVLPGGGVVAISTCRSGCVDDFGIFAIGSDVLLAGNNPTTGTWTRRLIPYGGEQHGRAIARHPSANAFLAVGDYDAIGFNPQLPGTSVPCPIVSEGDVDVFAAFYAFQGGDFQCTGARGLGSPGKDEARAAARDDTFGFVSVHTAEAGTLGATPGPYVAKVSPGAVPWSTNVDGSFPESEVLSLVMVGGRLSVSGRRADLGFLQLINPQNGALGAARALTAADPSAINAHARTGDDVWLMGGRYEGGADFGGALGPQPAPVDGNADGFVARIAPPM